MVEELEFKLQQTNQEKENVDQQLCRKNDTLRKVSEALQTCTYELASHGELLQEVQMWKEQLVKSEEEKQVLRDTVEMVKNQSKEKDFLVKQIEFQRGEQEYHAQVTVTVSSVFLNYSKGCPMKQLLKLKVVFLVSALYECCILLLHLHYHLHLHHHCKPSLHFSSLATAYHNDNKVVFLILMQKLNDKGCPGQNDD